MSLGLSPTIQVSVGSARRWRMAYASGAGWGLLGQIVSPPTTRSKNGSRSSPLRMVREKSYGLLLITASALRGSSTWRRLASVTDTPGYGWVRSRQWRWYERR